MTTEESAMYQAEQQRLQLSIRLISDCLATLETFCYSMPVDWILGNQQQDFISAFLYMLREPSLQVQAVACLDQVSLRKLDNHAWMKLITQLPPAVNEANAAVQNDAAQGDLEGDLLTLQLPFHRGLSRLLAHLLSGNIALVTSDKKIVSVPTSRL